MRRIVLLLAASGAAGCAYYNGMWSAEHLAGQARGMERQERTAEARTYWAQAAIKAESVVAQHPTSRWADAALVLEGEALARSGSCAEATAPLARADSIVRDVALRERAALVSAECALAAGDPIAAGRALAAVTQSRDPGRRSEAAFLAGRAAALEGDQAAAIEWLARSRAPGAAPARLQALLAAGRLAEALALADTVARARFREDDWSAVLVAVRQAAGTETASATLDTMLARRRGPAGARARLLLADGDALLAAGRPDAAVRRYAQVVATAPDSASAALARVHAIRVLAVQAESLSDLQRIERELRGVTAAGAAGEAAGEANALLGLVRRVRNAGDASEIERFRLAEAARDSLGAPRLAGFLYLKIAYDAPASLFAPKALVAAATLLPARHDSLIAVLDSAYARSPYTLAMHGEPSPAFDVAEDSLATALGLAVGAPAPVVALRVAAPVPGPRGPWPDAVLEVAAAPPQAARPAATPRPTPRADAPREERPVHRGRGVAPRDSL